MSLFHSTIMFALILCFWSTFVVPCLFLYLISFCSILFHSRAITIVSWTLSVQYQLHLVTLEINKLQQNNFNGSQQETQNKNTTMRFYSVLLLTTCATRQQIVHPVHTHIHTTYLSACIILTVFIETIISWWPTTRNNEKPTSLLKKKQLIS